MSRTRGDTGHRRELLFGISSREKRNDLERRKSPRNCLGDLGGLLTLVSRIDTRKQKYSSDGDGGVEEGGEDCEGDDDACDGGINRPHVEGNLGHDRQTLDKQAERPLLYAFAFALSVTTRSIISPPCQRYRFSHCLPGIATNTVNDEIRRLMYYTGFEVVKISMGVQLTPEGRSSLEIPS